MLLAAPQGRRAGGGRGGQGEGAGGRGARRARLLAQRAPRAALGSAAARRSDALPAWPAVASLRRADFTAP
eukprot:9484483-Pyramimonas_sp.AAC.1